MVAPAETAPNILVDAQVTYENLGPTIHGIVERLITRHAGGMRVDHVEPGNLELAREILVAAEGQHLPRYYFDEQQSYIHGGRTPVVERRHSQFEVVEEGFDNAYGTRSAWIHMPVYADEPEAPAAPQETWGSYRKELLAGAALAIAEWSGLAYGIKTNNSDLIFGTMAGGMLAGGGLGVHVLRRGQTQSL